MDWSGPGFVLAIIAMSTAGWILTTWIRARHGYSVENEWSGQAHKADPAADRKIELLANENARMTGQIGRLEERIAVLERIATDGSGLLDREIEALRGRAN